MIELAEIEGIIAQFMGEQQRELIEYYVNEARKILDNLVPIKRKKVVLLRDCLRYMPEEERSLLVGRVFSTKLLQTRALILDLIISNYSLEKYYISRPENWVEAILQDIHATFDLKADHDLLEIYNRKLCDEIRDIFCSCQRFNTAGNQLLLNIVAYKAGIGQHVSYDFDALIRVFEERFVENKKLEMETIYRIYEEHMKEKERKKNSKKN